MQGECDEPPGTGLVGTSERKEPAGREVGPCQENLVVCQLNLHHSKAASAMMTRCMEEDKVDIAILQEPWILHKRIKGLSERKAKLYQPSTDGRVRTCILVRHGVLAVHLPHLCSPDLTVVRIGDGAGAFMVASAYLPYDSPDQPPSKEVENLVKYCEERNIGVIIGCDANAHNTVWGSTNNNDRGEQLLEFVERYNLLVANRGAQPTFVDARRAEVIDVTLICRKILNRVENWRVVDRLTMSDHRAIQFEVKYGIRCQRNSRKIRIPKNTDPMKYEAKLRETLTRKAIKVPGNTTEVESHVKHLSSAMVKAFEVACPFSIIDDGDPTPWWCMELESMKKKARKAFNQHMRRRTPETWADYKARKRELKNLIRRCKRQSWRDFCTGMETISGACRLQKMVSKDPFSKVELIRKTDGTMAENLEESLQVLMEVHFPGSFKSDDPWAHLETGMQRVDRLEAERMITMDGVKSAIRSFSPYKTPGTDGIFPAMMQWGEDLIAPRLRGIFVTCLATGYVPRLWREAKVVFLPKPGKKDYAEAKSFRPISLTSFLLKTMERVVADCLESTSLMQNPLSRCQHAYRAGRSTESALHELVRVVEKELFSGGIAMATFMDIEGAFDKICFGRLRQALTERNVNPMIVNWVDGMLRNRAVNMQNGRVKVRGRVSRGCPQGGVLSPTLWNVTVDSLLTRLDESGIHTIGYADDIALVVCGKFIDTISDIMKGALGMVEEWCREQGLTVNAGKSDNILFTRKRVGLRREPLRLFGAEINMSMKVKYLGVTLDSKLNWNEHVEDKIQKAKRVLFQCRRVCGLKWGLNPETMKWIYTMMVRPVITYASVIWWTKVSQKTIKKRLDRVQRLACVGITGAIRTTPTSAMEVLLGMLPLDLEIKKTAAITALRMLRNATWHESTALHGHARILDIVQRDVRETRMPMDGRQRVKVTEKCYKTRIADGAVDEEIAGYDISIFTDGSLMEDRAGAGIYSEELNLFCALSLGRFVSVYQAEMLGVMHALDHLIDGQISDKKIVIALDNQSVIRCMQRTDATSRLAVECLTKLNRCAQANELTLMWVKGHSGIEQNEIADSLAREGSANEFCGPEPRIAIGDNMVASLIKQWMDSEHRKRWEEAVDCRQAKATVKWSRSEAAKVIRHNRKTLSWLTALVTGHGPYMYHLRKMTLTDNDMCRLCLEEPETAAHILCQCPAMAGIRLTIVGRPFIGEAQIDQLTYKDMLELTRDAYIRSILTYECSGQ